MPDNYFRKTLRDGKASWHVETKIDEDMLARIYNWMKDVDRWW
ncbi:hypothetical protein [Chitinophaga sp. Cy-1792]|nr:hypothetical protein [Chitinophaga sp. Cy-1792]